MEQEQAWQVIRRERAALGNLLESLDPEEWDQPSLCEGWSVRDVAAHVISWPETSLRQGLVALLRAHGSYNRMIHDEAQRRAQRPTEQIVSDFRRLAGSRRRPPVVTYHEGLLDVLVHTQDIAIPLGRRHDMPVEAARDSADRAWRIAFPFFARRRLAGYRLEATDCDWAVGQGASLRGPAAALLLLVTGRTALVGQLRGDGVQRLSQQTDATT